MVAYGIGLNRLIPLCLVVTLAAACARTHVLPQMEQGWQSALTEARDTPPVAAQWREHVEPDGVRDLWLRAELPRGTYTHIAFRAYVDDLALYVDRDNVYSFHDAAFAERLTLHVAPIHRGRFLYVRIPHARAAAHLRAPLLATPETLPFALEQISAAPLRDDATDILLGLVMLILGAISITASLLRRRGEVLPLRYFGIFTALYGLRLLAESYLPMFLGASFRDARYVQSFITYIIPIPGWTLVTLLVGAGWRRTLRWQVIAFTVFAPIGIAADLLLHEPQSAATINNILVVIGSINLLANLASLRYRSALERRVVAAGTIVFMALALNNNLASLGVLPWEWRGETPGFIAFVASLGFAATRGFLRGEREQLAIENELDTAREIQRSLLPLAMPDVEGLRVHAGFDPATTVAGDLYDFLRVDSRHAGVLVADVAGHGVPAALIASMVKVAVSSHARLAHDPAAILAELNATLRRDVRRAFVTATYLWFDLERRCVTVCNAGHAPPLLYRNGTFHDLGPHGVLLGRFANPRYVASTIELEAGDRIVAFTDGILEARNAREEQFGEERLKELIRAHERDAATLTSAVIAAVHRWRTAGDPDDLTIVAIDVS